MTPQFIFYASPDGIYAVDKAKNPGLTLGQGVCLNRQDCTLISKETSEVHSMVWDGDGNIYVADTSKKTMTGTKGGVFKIPSGEFFTYLIFSIVRHELS